MRVSDLTKPGYEGGTDESRMTGASLPVKHEPAVDSAGCIWMLM